MSDPSAPEIRERLEPHLDRPGLTGEERLLLLAAGATARGTESWLRPFFREALDRGCGAADLSEIVLQTYLFAGYPRAINALLALRAESPTYLPLEERPEEPLASTEHGRGAAGLQARGERLCRIIYGEHYAGLRRNIADLHPDLDRWMVAEGYGRVLGRPWVEVRIRELAALTSLVVLDVPRQIRSHLLGARHVAASDTEIEETVRQAEVFAPAEAVARALELWQGLQ